MVWAFFPLKEPRDRILKPVDRKSQRVPKPIDTIFRDPEKEPVFGPSAHKFYLWVSRFVKRQTLVRRGEVRIGEGRGGEGRGEGRRREERSGEGRGGRRGEERRISQKAAEKARSQPCLQESTTAASAERGEARPPSADLPLVGFRI